MGSKDKEFQDSLECVIKGDTGIARYIHNGIDEFPRFVFLGILFLCTGTRRDHITRDAGGFSDCQLHSFPAISMEKLDVDISFCKSIRSSDIIEQ